MLTFSAKQGLIAVATPFFACPDACPAVRRDGGGPSLLLGAWEPRDGHFERSVGQAVYRLTLESPSANESRIRLDVRTEAAEGLAIDELLTFVLPPARNEWRVPASTVLHYVHNTILGEPIGVKLLTRPGEFAEPFAASKAMTLLHDPASGQSLLIGVLPDASSLTVIDAVPENADGSGSVGWTARCDIRARLMPGRTFSTGTIVLLSGTDPFALLERYGDEWKALRQCSEKPSRKGWNSWDYYSGSVRREDMDANLDAAKGAFGERLKSWVIDEGWESQWGAWVPNWKFPQGLADYCKRVRDANGEPGIWSAPLCMNIYSPFVRHNPGWLVRNARGEPVTEIMAYGYMGFLDPTRADVRQFLADVYGRLRQDGFEYFKLDFLPLVYKAHHFHDPTVPRGQVIRQAVQGIRDVVGEDAYIMSMLHMEPLAGLIDAARVTNDVHNFWGHIRVNAFAAGLHYWKHRRLWNNDIDFAIVRCAELTDDPFLNRPFERQVLKSNDYWYAGPYMDLEEARTWLNLCILSGGDLILSDALPKLSEAGLVMLRRALDIRPARAARPLDLFSHNEPPARWRAETEEGWLMGYFNWTDVPAAVAIRSEDWGGGSVRLLDFWLDKPLAGATPSFTLPPHHSRLVRVVRRSEA